jgi:hypothetical protein
MGWLHNPLQFDLPGIPNNTGLSAVCGGQYFKFAGCYVIRGGMLR